MLFRSKVITVTGRVKITRIGRNTELNRPITSAAMSGPRVLDVMSSPAVAQAAAAIPRELFESEMFGHKKGAFTDASADRIGRFEMANKGTIFLDEIGDMPMEAQTRLLRPRRRQPLPPPRATRLPRGRCP